MPGQGANIGRQLRRPYMTMTYDLGPVTVIIIRCGSFSFAAPHQHDKLNVAC